VATHDLRHAERLRKRVVRIEQGKVVSDGGQDTCTT
jgi:ABC-type sulfate/molybdate transport systems ATPase subunit